MNARITCTSCGYYLDTDHHAEYCLFSDADWDYESARWLENFDIQEEINADNYAQEYGLMMAEDHAESLNEFCGCAHPGCKDCGSYAADSWEEYHWGFSAMHPTEGEYSPHDCQCTKCIIAHDTLCPSCAILVHPDWNFCDQCGVALKPFVRAPIMIAHAGRTMDSREWWQVTQVLTSVRRAR